jgi:hypothetical protein
LIGAANLQLDAIFFVHCPPIPSLEERVAKFGYRHAFATFHSYFDTGLESDSSRDKMWYTHESRASIGPSRMLEPSLLISVTALTSASHLRLLRTFLRRLISLGYWCFMPKHLTLVQRFDNCRSMLSTFIICVLEPCRVRAVVLPDGSPICTVPPPSCSVLTCRCCSVSWGAHQANGVVAVDVHPVQRHERKKMSNMK